MNEGESFLTFDNFFYQKYIAMVYGDKDEEVESKKEERK
jgi:hypothetical protein